MEHICIYLRSSWVYPVGLSDAPCQHSIICICTHIRQNTESSAACFHCRSATATHTIPRPSRLRMGQTEMIYVPWRDSLWRPQFSQTRFATLNVPIHCEEKSMISNDHKAVKCRRISFCWSPGTPPTFYIWIISPWELNSCFGSHCERRMQPEKDCGASCWMHQYILADIWWAWEESASCEDLRCRRCLHSRQNELSFWSEEMFYHTPHTLFVITNDSTHQHPSGINHPSVFLFGGVSSVEDQKQQRSFTFVHSFVCKHDRSWAIEKKQWIFVKNKKGEGGCAQPTHLFLVVCTFQFILVWYHHSFFCAEPEEFEQMPLITREDGCDGLGIRQRRDCTRERQQLKSQMTQSIVNVVLSLPTSASVILPLFTL